MDTVQEQAEAPSSKITLVDRFTYAGLPGGLLGAAIGAISEICSKPVAPEFLIPMGVVGGIGVLVGTFGVGAEYVQSAKKDAEDAWNEIEAKRSTVEPGAGNGGLDCDGGM